MPGCALCKKEQVILKRLTVGGNSLALCDEYFVKNRKEAKNNGK